VLEVLRLAQAAVGFAQHGIDQIQDAQRHLPVGVDPIA
jgi:hypothetical protein